MTSSAQMWDRRFSEHPWPTDPDPALVEFAGCLPPGRSLDLGSGPGRNSLWLAGRGWQVTAVDASGVALSQAAERAASLALQIETVHADVTSWDAGCERYELAVVANLHPGADALATVLATAAASLVPGGHLFVVGHDVASLGRSGPPDPHRLLTPDRLRLAMPATVEIHLLERRTRPALPAPGRPRAPDDADRGTQEQLGDSTVVIAWASKHPAG